MNGASDLPESAIAIIGMAGRFPGARNVTEFWRNLRAGIESLERFSDQELLTLGIDPALLSNPSYVKAGSCLTRAAEFDAAFFGINPREAEIIDPQQRIFLECAWEAIEDAGYDVDRLVGPVGVFAGASMNTYINANLLANPQSLAAAGAYQAMIGNDKDFLATRVSYKLNLRGPSLTLQTACSTSLVAVHMACQNLLSQQCDMALAGGVSLTFPQRAGYLYQEGMIASPDGKVRPFDAEGRGIRSGEGVGLVVLKRLRDAIADRDAIRAVILGTAVNNDGAQKVGYTAPSVNGQAEVITTAQAVADVDPSTITYIEAHGTSTPVGDPIEIAALTRAFRARTALRQFCAIGSVKSNIGHLDAAAGIAGLIKTVLALQHAEIPPSLNFTSPNPQIDFATSPFFVNTTLRAWTPAGPRRAGVSSFGIGGTNVHAILQQWRDGPDADLCTPPSEQQIVLSARSAAALDKAVEQLAECLEHRPDIDLADLAYTLQMGRRVFDHRALLVAADSATAAASLRNVRSLARDQGEAGTRAVNFMFSGQGSQYAAMGWDLYQSEVTFRAALDHCADALRYALGLDLRSVLFPEYARLQGIPPAADLLNETRITQPALFAVEYALAKLWETWGVRPQAMIGHSIGEYVAACLAGVFELETALTLVAERGALMQRAQPGAMLAVQLDESQVVALLGPDTDIAALNAPGSCVVSGPIAAIDALTLRLEQAGVGCRRLRTSHAFHSATMDEVIAPFVARMAREVLHRPSIPFVSNLTGTWITAEQATDPCYWGQHLRGAVRFADGLRVLARDPHCLLLEVGPGNTLGTLAQQVLPGRGEAVFSSLPHPLDQTPARSHLRRGLGRLWLAGAPVNWQGLHAGALRRVPLPTYPFERRRFWVQPLRAAGQSAASLRKPLDQWFWLPSWLRTLPAPGRATTPCQTEQRWLVFANEDADTAALLGELRTRGIGLTIVWAGDSFSEMPGGTRIRGARREDYTSLLERHPHFNCVVHLWNAGAPDAGPVRLERGRDLAFYSLTFLAQALADVGRREPLTVLAVSTDMQRVDNSERLRVERSLLIGPVLFMSQEVPIMRARSVDLAAQDWTSGNAPRLADVLQFEAEHHSPAHLVAWRGGYRWEQSSAPLPLPTPDESQLPLRERGVYLITGGTGGLGLAIARDLAATRRARLVLISRSGAPSDQAWEAVRMELQKHGAEVRILAADVSDPLQMAEVLAQTRACFGELHGIIHAAGVPGRGLLQMMTAADSEPVLRPKLEGTLTLEHLLDGSQLDFLALFSGINSTFASHGSPADSSANAFLDGFAQAGLARCARRVVAINWSEWSGVGMAARALTAERGSADSDTLRQTITPQEGVQAFYRVLAREDVRQLYVTPIPLPELLAAAARHGTLTDHAPESTGTAATSTSPRASSHHERPALQNAFIAPRNREEEQLASIWSDLLGIAPIGVEDNFFELGGHSLLATRLLARLQDVFRVRVLMRTIFECSTIEVLLQSIRSLQLAESRADATAAAEQREEIEL